MRNVRTVAHIERWMSSSWPRFELGVLEDRIEVYRFEVLPGSGSLCAAKLRCFVVAFPLLLRDR